MKIKGIVNVRQSFEVELEMTVDLFESLSMNEQNQMIKNSIDFNNVSVENVEIDDDVDIED